MSGYLCILRVDTDWFIMTSRSEISLLEFVNMPCWARNSYPKFIIAEQSIVTPV